MLWILPLLMVLPPVADWLYLRRHARMFRYRKILVAAVTVCDLMPLLFMGLFRFGNDDSTRGMLAVMWIFYAYLLLTLPRIAFYIVRLFGRSRPVKILAVAAAALVVAVLIQGATTGRHTLRVEHVTIRSDRLPKSFENFRIAFFSDLHVGTLIRPEAELDALIDTLNALRPDVVLFGGDLVNLRYTELGTMIMHRLSGIRSRYGTFSVIGNHDTGVYVRDTLRLPPEVNTAELIRREEAMGWCVLDNRTVYLRRDNDSIALSGITYDRHLNRQRHDRRLPDFDFGNTYRDVPATVFNITVSHIPQLWDDILDAGYGDLTLSGHVHGMQCRIRLFGHAYSPAQWLYKRWSGRYDEEHRTLYINDGIGCVGYPMRLGVKPEITLIELQR